MEPLVSRAEVEVTMLAILDIQEEVQRIRELLDEDDDDGEEVPEA